MNEPMPFEAMSDALKALGKSRQWLADKSGRNLWTVHACLAPNGHVSRRRTEWTRAAFAAVIEAEQARQASHGLPVGLIARLRGPVPDSANDALVAGFSAIAKELGGRVDFIGRENGIIDVRIVT